MYNVRQRRQSNWNSSCISWYIWFQRLYVYEPKANQVAFEIQNFNKRN